VKKRQRVVSKLRFKDWKSRSQICFKVDHYIVDVTFILRYVFYNTISWTFFSFGNAINILGNNYEWRFKSVPIFHRQHVKAVICIGRALLTFWKANDLWIPKGERREKESYQVNDENNEKKKRNIHEIETSSLGRNITSAMYY
jgi:hypothetical protein